MMPTPCTLARTLTLATLGLSLLGCPSEESPRQAQPRARARAEDPPLVHTWNIPAESSRAIRGDLGSKPPALADALMQSGAMPTFVHQTAQACASEDALPSAGDLVLRFVVSGGALTSVQGDPAGPATTCFQTKLQAKGEMFASLPDGNGLVRVELSAPPTP